MMLVRVLVLLAIVLCSAVGHREDSVEIPLDQIWALDMPGTRDVRELDPRQDLRETAISRIGGKLLRGIDERAKAGPCFLVAGEGKEALSNAAKVIVEGKSPTKTFPPNKDASLVFYAYPAPGYVHLHSVRRSDSTVTIKYQVVIHRSLNVTAHFALIPLGKLSAGQVSVETVEVPSETLYPNHARTDRAVCNSCTFVIQNKGAEP
jgi:hypothetical protein